MFQRLNGRKGLIAIVLMMAVVMVVPFVASHYEWEVKHTIDPLTSDKSFTLTAASGCTSGSESHSVGSAGSPSIDVAQGGAIKFMVKDSEVDAIVTSGAYWDLTVKVTIRTSPEDDLVEEDSFLLIDDGASKIDAETDIADIDLTAGAYYAIVTFDYWTADVESSVTNTLTLYIHFVEA